MKTKGMTRETAFEAIAELEKRIDFNNRLNKFIRGYIKENHLESFNGYNDSPTKEMIETFKGILDKEEWMKESLKREYLYYTGAIYGQVYSPAVNTYILKDLHDCQKYIKTFDEAIQTGNEENELFKVERDIDNNRINLYFDGKPEEEVRNVLKHNGFRWSPAFTCWTRQLTQEAESSLRRIKQQLELA